MRNQWPPSSTPADIQKYKRTKYKNTNGHKVIRQLFPVTSPLMAKLLEKPVHGVYACSPSVGPIGRKVVPGEKGSYQ